MPFPPNSSHEVRVGRLDPLADLQPGPGLNAAFRQALQDAQARIGDRITAFTADLFPDATRTDAQQVTLDALHAVMDEIDRHRAVVLCRPELVDQVRAAIARRPDAGLFEVRGDSTIPAGQIIIAKPDAFRPMLPLLLDRGGVGGFGGRLSSRPSPLVEVCPVAELGEQALMTWLDVDELKPYPWATVPCPGCGELELSAAIAHRAVDFVCMACGYLTQICSVCHQCDSHQCGIGISCPEEE